MNNLIASYCLPHLQCMRVYRCV